MTNNTIVGIYYNQDGNVAKIVHADNDDYTPHDDPNLTCVFLDKETYESLSPAINFGGIPAYHDLNKATVAVLQTPARGGIEVQSSSLADVIQTKIDEVENRLAEDALLTADPGIEYPDP